MLTSSLLVILLSTGQIRSLADSESIWLSRNWEWSEGTSIRPLLRGPYSVRTMKCYVMLWSVILFMYSYRLNHDVVFSIKQCCLLVLMEWINIFTRWTSQGSSRCSIFRTIRTSTAFFCWYSHPQWPSRCRWCSSCRCVDTIRYPMPLDQFISRRIGPKVILCFTFCIFKSTWTNKERCKDLATHRIGNKCLFLIIFITVGNQMIDYSNKFLTKQSNSYP